MTPENHPPLERRQALRPHFEALSYRKHLWWYIAAWSLIVLGSWASNARDRRIARNEVATKVLHTMFQKDLLFRQWVTAHGGVYVPVTDQTHPSKYLAELKIPDQNLITPSGKHLTLINPAYATRQIYELQDQTTSVHGHITSLTPIRPENGPDGWERQALISFENGKDQAVTLTKFNGVPSIRLMHPLKVEQGCLKCHAQQGYQIGQIRGGISVTAPMSLFVTPGRDSHSGFTHLIMWLLGTGGFLSSGFRLRKQSQLLDTAEQEREKLIHELRDALHNVKQLSGLIPICAACKKIRDDKGYWNQVEKYVCEHTDAKFTHGYCPDCARIYLPSTSTRKP